MAQLTCQNLRVGYDGKSVLQDLSFEVFAGDCEIRTPMSCHLFCMARPSYHSYKLFGDIKFLHQVVRDKHILIGYNTLDSIDNQLVSHTRLAYLFEITLRIGRGGNKYDCVTGTKETIDVRLREEGNIIGVELCRR